MGKLAQKEYETRHEWVCQVIHWQLCNRSNFDKYEQMVYAHHRFCPRE